MDSEVLKRKAYTLYNECGEEVDDPVMSISLVSHKASFFSVSYLIYKIIGLISGTFKRPRPYCHYGGPRGVSTGLYPTRFPNGSPAHNRLFTWPCPCGAHGEWQNVGHLFGNYGFKVCFFFGLNQSMKVNVLKIFRKILNQPNGVGVGTQPLKYVPMYFFYFSW